MFSLRVKKGSSEVEISGDNKDEVLATFANFKEYVNISYIGESSGYPTKEERPATEKQKIFMVNHNIKYDDDISVAEASSKIDDYMKKNKGSRYRSNSYKKTDRKVESAPKAPIIEITDPDDDPDLKELFGK